MKNLLFIMLLIWKFSHTLPPQSALWAIMMLHEHDVNVNIPRGGSRHNAMSLSLMNMLTTAHMQAAVNQS